MSETSDERDQGPGITDDQLPEDVRPSDDNPLAKNPGEDDEGEAGGTGGMTAEKLEGMPDMGQPGT
ncbi:MAG: hypothetical protein ACTHOK_05355 [Nocardioidaceae bacterium]